MRFLLLSSKRRGGLTFGGVGIAEELLNNFPLHKMCNFLGLTVGLVIGTSPSINKDSNCDKTI